MKEPLFEMSLLPQAVSARERTYHRQSGSNSQLLLSGPVTHPMKEDVKEKASPRLSEDVGVVTYIQPQPHSQRGYWFGCFGPPHVLAEMPTAVACPNSTVS